MTEPAGPKPETALDPVFGEAVGRLGPALLAGLDALEQAFRRLHPPDIREIQARLAPIHEALADAQAHFEATSAPEPLDSFRSELLAASRRGLSALDALVHPGDAGVMGALRAMHDHAEAQARLYPLRLALPPVSAYFAEAFQRADLAGLEAAPSLPSDSRPGDTAGAEGAPRVGLFRSGEAGARGGFDLYVPESYDASEPRPLVVALHGGSGRGADFLWSWLREARSRGCLLLAPSSRGSTWSLNAPEVDGRNLREMVEYVATQWRVDREKVLLTGLSDGATMSLLTGLAEDVPYTHLAPISGVLHPMNFGIGNVDRAEGRPIYLVHGALDWMFPVDLAREAAKVLEEAGAELVFRELPDLSHTYPREENARILEWFDPGLREDVVSSRTKASP